MDQACHTNKKHDHARHALPILLPAVAAGLLMPLAYLIQYDVGTANYFRSGAILPILASIFAALSALIGTVLAIRIPRGKLSISLPAPRAAIAAAIGCTACAVALFVSMHEGQIDWTHALAFLLSVLSAIYELTVALCDLKQERVRDLAILLGFAPVFNLILLNALHYFDQSLEMNAPLKITIMLGLLCAMVSITSEIRYLIGTALPRVYLMLAAWTAAAGALSALAVPVAYFAGILQDTEYLSTAFAVLGFSVTSAIRIIDLLREPCSEKGAEPS